MFRDTIVDYSLWLRIVSTIVFLIGGLSNLIVLIVARYTKKDSRAYLLLIRLVAFGNILHALSGWGCTNRHTLENGLVIFISYGPLGFIHPRLSAIIDGISTQAVSFNQLMICMMMVFRSLILFDYHFKKRTMILATLLLYVITFPTFYAMLWMYVPITSVTISSNLQFEVSRTAAYAFNGTSFAFNTQMLYKKVPHITIAICIVCCAIVLWKLYKVNKILSKKTTQIYKGFVYLMLIDSLIIFIYLMVININFAQSEEAVLFMSFFSHPIFAIPRISQGLALLLLVPYLRSAFFGFFKKPKTSPITVLSTANNYSTQ